MRTDRIVGHDRALRTVRALAAAGRVGHAYRLTGPGGVGKKLVALLFARGALCPAAWSAARMEAREAPSLGCGTCASCQAVDGLRHPDLLLYHDFHATRWEERSELARRLGGAAPTRAQDEGEEPLAAALAELREAGFLLPPHHPADGKRRWEGLTLDPGPVFRGGDGGRRSGVVYDPSSLAEDLGRRESRGMMSTAAARLAAALYYGDSSRVPYRGSLGIHLVARREPLTPDRGSLRQHLARTSLWGGRKVAVIDDAHLMTEEAQNALLKTLEEPPAGSLLLLVTDKPDILQPTVRSRAPEIVCGRLAPEMVTSALADQGLGAAEAGFLAAWADGSLGRALEAELEGLVGRRALLLELHRALVAGDLARAMGLAPAISREELAADRVRRLRGAACGLELLLLWYRDLVVAAELGERGRFLHGDLAADILRESRAAPGRLWEDLFGLVARTVERFGPSSDFRLEVESLIAGLALRLADHRAAAAGAAGGR